MEITKATNILNKYKDYLPFDYNKFYNNLLDGNLDAINYMTFLIKHDASINDRNYCKPIIRTRRPGDLVDDNIVCNRVNYIVYSETITYFDGYY